MRRSHVGAWACTLALAWLVTVACVLEASSPVDRLRPGRSSEPQRRPWNAALPGVGVQVHHLTGGSPVALASLPVGPRMLRGDRRAPGFQPTGSRGEISSFLPPRPPPVHSAVPATRPPSAAARARRSGSLVAGTRAPPVV